VDFPGQAKRITGLLLIDRSAARIEAAFERAMAWEGRQTPKEFPVESIEKALLCFAEGQSQRCSADVKSEPSKKQIACFR